VKSRKTDKIGLFRLFSPYITKIIFLKKYIFFSFASPQLSCQKEKFSEKISDGYFSSRRNPFPQVTPMLIATVDCHKYAVVFYSAAYHRELFTVRNISNYPTSALYWAANLNCLLSSSAGFVLSCATIKG
jgi:hypothetical protein